MNNKVCWQPPRHKIEASELMAFVEFVNQRHALQLNDFYQLYDWSISEIEFFWDAVWDFCEIKASVKGNVILNQKNTMEGAQFFPQAKLNFAKNLLSKGKAGDEALVFVREDAETIRLSYGQLHRQVATLANFLRASGVVKGDRVAGYLPNMCETVVAMLATTALGAVWSSCSPDFGIQGALDRFAQIEPKVLFVTDVYSYAGKPFNVMAKNVAIVQQLVSLKQVVLVPLMGGTLTLDEYSKSSAKPWHLYKAIISAYHSDSIDFVDVAFNDPLYIMFSSGTTGVPKCIVHGVGGTLIQHLKEHRLHLGLSSRDCLFYATTCGWMMWNWLVSGLATGAKLVLYDGSLFYPQAERLFDLIDEESISVFGVSAKYIDALSKQQAVPRNTHNLSSLRMLLSTGSPLMPEAYEYVYSNIKSDVCLSSISGGTDIISCFALGCEILPVRRGELQCRGLGMAVEAWDDDDVSVVAKKGELVCVKPFPSMPVSFWNDDDGSKYHRAYFAQFDDVWCHGDFIEITDSGGVLIYGRSDAVLNPGGVRIGTAEIYRQVERLAEVNEALVIGQQWENDVRLVLFVCLAKGVALDALLKQKICHQIRSNTTPRHVPNVIIAVPEIPRTRSGKIVEMAVSDLVHGKAIRNREAIMNPDALDYFNDLPELNL